MEEQTKEKVNVKTQPQFTIDKVTLPIECQREEDKEGLTELLLDFETIWENECPISKEYLDLKRITIFSTDDEGYYRFYFKNKPDKDINNIITIPNRGSSKLIPDIYKELNHLFDNDGASLEPNHWWVCKNMAKNRLEISILMAWSS